MLSPGAPERLAAEGAVEVALGEVHAGGRAAVAPGERPERLQPPRHRRRKALFPAQVSHHQLIDGRAHLQPHKLLSSCNEFLCCLHCNNTFDTDLCTEYSAAGKKYTFHVYTLLYLERERKKPVLFTQAYDVHQQSIGPPITAREEPRMIILKRHSPRVSSSADAKMNVFQAEICGEGDDKHLVGAVAAAELFPSSHAQLC